MKRLLTTTFSLLCLIRRSGCHAAGGPADEDEPIMYTARWENCFTGEHDWKSHYLLRLRREQFEAERERFGCQHGVFVIKIDAKVAKTTCPVNTGGPSLTHSALLDTSAFLAEFEKTFPLPPRTQVRMTSELDLGLKAEDGCVQDVVVSEMDGRTCDANVVRQIFSGNDPASLSNLPVDGEPTWTKDVFKAIRVDSKCGLTHLAEATLKATVRIPGGDPKTNVQVDTVRLFNATCPEAEKCNATGLEGAKACMQNWLSSGCGVGEVHFYMKSNPKLHNAHTLKACGSSMHRVFDLRGDAEGAAANVGLTLPASWQLWDFYPGYTVSRDCTAKNLGFYRSSSPCDDGAKGELLPTEIVNNTVTMFDRVNPQISDRYLHLISNDTKCHVQAPADEPALTARSLESINVEDSLSKPLPDSGSARTRLSYGLSAMISFAAAYFAVHTFFLGV